MADVSVIGQGTTIRGRISGAVDLEIAGHVDGEICIDGELTVDRDGLVSANIEARVIIVRGAVKGDLIAQELLSLEAGARVVGDLRAPRLAIAQGALVRGQVQAGSGASSGKLTSRASAGAKPASRVESAPRVEPRVERGARPEVKAPPPRVVPQVLAARTNGSHAATAPEKKGPPPLVVPVLKKAKGAIAKRR
jgi:cytoskeletal protein CcmA (bactofilin family)